MTMHPLRRERSDFATPFDPFGVLNASAFDAAIRAGETYGKAWLAWQQELLKFISNRLVWDSRVSEALAGCKTPADVAEVQKDWLMTTAQDYFDETTRLFQFAWKLVPSVLPPLPTAPDSEHGRRRSTQAAAE
jgi:hypothetical protein